jgi:site-specific DNA-methyltransferase (adenine-specific)
LWEQYSRVIKDNGAIILTASQPFTTKLINSNIKMFKYNLVWEKPQGVDPFMAKKRPLNNIEDIVIFYKRQPTYNPQYEKGKPYKITRDKKPRNYEITDTVMKETTTVNEGYRLPKRIIRSKQERGLHPTQKPVPLFEYLIKTYTNEGETVLDNCAGSFTTAVACDNTNRNWICIEKEEEYCNIGLTRVNDNRERLSLPFLNNIMKKLG